MEPATVPTQTTSTRPQRGIGIYLRKSSDIQGDLSLPAQERIIRAVLVEPSGQPVYQVYKDVLSGTRPDRADYQQMLTDARAGKLTAVYFHKVNRFGRDTAEGLAAANELRRLGVEIRIADLPALDVRKSEGMFVFSFLLALGQYEVENLGSEAIKGMREMVLAGGWPFVAPDGYKNCREHLNSHKRRCWIAIDRPRAAVIRLIFRWYAKGNVTLRDMVTALNALHKRRMSQGKSGCLTSAGKQWHIQSLANLLGNPFYIGQVVVPSWNLRVEGTHQAIIDPVTFARVQDVLGAHSQGPLTRRDYLLQGRVVIKLEDHLLVLLCSTATQRHRRYYYYYKGRSRCHLDSVMIDAAVLARIRERVTALGQNPYVSVAQRMRQALTNAQGIARKTHADLGDQRKRLLRLGVIGQFSEAEVAGEMSRLTVEMTESDRECKRLASLADSQEQLIAEWQQIILTIFRWDQLNPKEQQELVRMLIQLVEVDLHGTVTNIVWTPIWDQLALT